MRRDCWNCCLLCPKARGRIRSLARRERDAGGGVCPLPAGEGWVRAFLMCRSATVVLCGYSDPRPSNLSLRRQREVTKRKATRLPLDHCAPRFCRGFPIGSRPDGKRAVPTAPLRAFPSKAPVLGAAERDKDMTPCHLCAMERKCEGLATVNPGFREAQSRLANFAFAMNSRKALFVCQGSAFGPKIEVNRIVKLIT
jgi:hypothetical protein